MTKTFIALACPAIALVVFKAGIWMHSTNNRAFDVLLNLPLIVGGCFGIAAFRSKDAGMTARLLGLVVAIVCVPYALFLLFVTMFGLA